MQSADSFYSKFFFNKIFVQIEVRITKLELNIIIISITDNVVIFFELFLRNVINL